jgi:phospholipase C
MLTGMQRAAARRRLSRAGANAGPLPRPDLAAGTDALPQIENIVVLMMENHSYDNYLGMLAGHGDGLPLDAQGQPTPTNPDGAGRAVPMHHFTSTVQHRLSPTQSWNASHLQYAGGACDGFVRSVEQTEPAEADATVPMGYWTEADIPFYYGLARTFPLATRWFCSCLGPTFPNRRFLIAGTANGLIDDLPFGMIDYPATGTIFDHLDAHGISWANYYQLPPGRIAWRRITHAKGLNWLRLLGMFVAGLIPFLIPALINKLQVTADLFPLGFVRSVSHVRPMAEFWRAAAEGTLPAVSIVDPDFGRTSEENPQDIKDGAALSAQVITSVMNGKGWPKMLLIWLYDEHGGYYDRVAPPTAVAPDDVPGRSPFQRFPILGLLRPTPLGKKIEAADDGPDTYERLGFRVPAVFVSPYARPGHVSDATYDHTSVLKIIQRKWNLPPLTRRDAAASDPVDDMLDLDGPLAFATPPDLPSPGRPPAPGTS